MSFRQSPTTAVLLVLALLAEQARAQPAPPPLPGAVNGTAPLLYVRFLGPQGMEVEFYRGDAEETRSFPTPVMVGMRPGYMYRVELARLPNHPGVSLFPSLEVIGSLRLPPRISARNFPAPVVVTEEDIEMALAGGMVTKVVYLEHPDKSVPGLGDADNPAETLMPATSDLLREARDIGRPVLVLRLGGREQTQEEMARQGIPGTILLPGEASLSLPRRPPLAPPITWQWYDPTDGPPPPEEEYIHNGGLNPSRGRRNSRSVDQAIMPGHDLSGQLRGLRAEDALAEYANQAGQRGIVFSNRVCLIVPRFGVLRHEIPLNMYSTATGLAGRHGVKGQTHLQARQPLGATSNQEMLSGLQGRQRASGQAGTTQVTRLVHFEVLDAEHVYAGPGVMLGTREVLLLSEVERTRLARQLALARALSQGENVSGFQQMTGTVVTGRVEAGPELVRATAETRDVTSVCLKELPQAPDKPLVLIKWADRESAKVGDVVTFFLRVQRPGQQTSDRGGRVRQPVLAPGVRPRQRRIEPPGRVHHCRERGRLAGAALGDERQTAARRERSRPLPGSGAVTGQPLAA